MCVCVCVWIRFVNYNCVTIPACTPQSVRGRQKQKNLESYLDEGLHCSWHVWRTAVTSPSEDLPRILSRNCHRWPVPKRYDPWERHRTNVRNDHSEKLWNTTGVSLFLTVEFKHGRHTGREWGGNGKDARVGQREEETCGCSVSEGGKGGMTVHRRFSHLPAIYRGWYHANA